MASYKLNADGMYSYVPDEDYRLWSAAERKDDWMDASRYVWEYMHKMTQVPGSLGESAIGGSSHGVWDPGHTHGISTPVGGGGGIVTQGNCPSYAHYGYSGAVSYADRVYVKCWNNMIGIVIDKVPSLPGWWYVNCGSAYQHMNNGKGPIFMDCDLILATGCSPMPVPQVHIYDNTTAHQVPAPAPEAPPAAPHKAGVDGEEIDQDAYRDFMRGL